MSENSEEHRMHDSAFVSMLDTLRELPPGDPTAVDRIMSAVRADAAGITNSATFSTPSRFAWRRLIVPYGAVAAAFVAGIVIGYDRSPGDTAANVAGQTTSATPELTPVSHVSGASLLPQVPFELRTTHAKSVFLVGDFNGWDPRATPMQPDLRGQQWSVTVPLRPGRYTYAFVVDDNIIPDPNVPGIHDPDYGAIVSVVIVKEP